MFLKKKKYYVNKLILSIFWIFYIPLWAIEDESYFHPIPDHQNLNNCSIGYLYIDSNEQGAGGGHVAILIDGLVFHYQRVKNTFFILEKTPFSSFLFHYSRILNRNIHLLCFYHNPNQPLLKTLKRNFQLRYQHQQYIMHKYLYWNEILSFINNPNTLSIPALGYFSFSQKQLLREIQSHFPHSLKNFIQEYDANPIFLILKSFHQLPPSQKRFYRESFISIEYDSHYISSKTKQSIQKYISDISHHIQKLEHSRRKDKYLAILELTIYREIWKHLYHKTLLVPYQIVVSNHNRLVPLRISKKILNLSQLQNSHHKLIHILRKQLISHLQYFFQLITSQQPLYRVHHHLQKLIVLANQLLLIQHNPDLVYNLNIGILKTPQLPFTHFKFPLDTKQQLLFLKTSRLLNKKISTIRNQHQSLFSYHLIQENCVTKLLDELYQYSNQHFTFIREINTSLYNGHFIPWVSYLHFKKILKQYKIQYKEYWFPSFRNELFIYLKQHHFSTIREISTISSSYYYFHNFDSFFIFFTEDHVYIRPILGTINTIGSLASISYHLLALPFEFSRSSEWGSSLYVNLRGFFFSFGEIFWISIRKGTYLPTRLPEDIQNLYFSIPRAKIKK